MKASFIVPVYFCDPSLYSKIDRALYSVTRLSSPIDPVQLVTVDDASPLELPGYWHMELTNPENLGFTATVNRGLAHASGDVMVVMNDDVEMTEECFSRILHMDPLSPTIASPMDTSGSSDERFGACWAVTRAAYGLLGPLDETYRNFYSDLGYYLRAKAAGVRIEKWEDVVLDHPESSTFKTLDKESLLAADRAAWEANNV